jgi:membrane-bound ClpP family serine protease
MGNRADGESEGAMQIALRFFGLSGKPTVGPMKLAAVLIVVGAACMAPGRHTIAFPIGGVLWLLGAVIAIRGWIRLQRLGRTKPN